VIKFLFYALWLHYRLGGEHVRRIAEKRRLHGRVSHNHTVGAIR
jgi:hypothetical protein